MMDATYHHFIFCPCWYDCLFRYLYEHLVEGDILSLGSRQHINLQTQQQPLVQLRRSAMLSAMQALYNLINTDPRLMGLLASKSALLPLLACMKPEATIPAVSQAGEALLRWLCDVHILNLRCRTLKWCAKHAAKPFWI